MSSIQESRYALPGMIAILIVIGGLAIGQLTFKPLRPITNTKIDFGDSSPYNIEARLWQDPFAAIDDYQKTQERLNGTEIPVAIEMAGAAIRQRLLAIEKRNREIDSGQDEAAAGSPRLENSSYKGDVIGLFIYCLTGEIGGSDCTNLLYELGDLRAIVERSYTNEFLLQTLGYGKSELKTEKIDKVEIEKFCNNEKIDTPAYFRCGIINLLLPASESGNADPNSPSSKILDNAQNGELLAEYRNQLLKAISELGQTAVSENVTHNIAKAGLSKKVLFMGVMLPGGKYSDLSERRMRSRYALITALAAQGYYPKDSEHIKVWRSPALRCRFSQQCVVDAAPFEHFSASGNTSIETKYSEVVVMWFKDEELGSQTLAKLSRVAFLIQKYAREAFLKLIDQRDHHNSEFKIDFKFLGPYSSHYHIGMSEQRMCPERNPDPEDYFSCVDRNIWDNETRKLKTYNQQKVDLTFMNWSATSSDVTGDSIDLTSPKSSNAASKDGPARANFKHYIHSDQEILYALTKEILKRGVTGKTGILPQSSALLVAESDSKYARDLRRDVKEMFISNGFQVSELTYLRGIDGQLPGEASPYSNFEAKKDRSGEKALVEAFSSVEYAEMPFGRSQFDYLRRSAIRLNEENRDVRVIGVLGSDIFDKLLVMQAFRSEFPSAIYFTTDLDAILLHPDVYPADRNLLVGSSYGLTVSDKTSNWFDSSGHEKPSFRDSYQTSLYVTTRAAVTDQESGIVDRTPSKKGGKRVVECANHDASVTGCITPRVFEVGYGEYFQINEYANVGSHSMSDGQVALQTNMNGGSSYHSSVARTLWYLLWAGLLIALIFISRKALTIRARSARQANGETGRKSLFSKLSYWGLGLAVCIVFLLLARVYDPYLVDPTLASIFPHSLPSQSETVSGLTICFLVTVAMVVLNYSQIFERAFSTDYKEHEVSMNRLDRIDRGMFSGADYKKHLVGIVIVLLAVQFYCVLWLFPHLFKSSEIWSLASGVSLWPAFAFCTTAVTLSIISVIFLQSTCKQIESKISDEYGLRDVSDRTEPSASHIRSMNRIWIAFLNELGVGRSITVRRLMVTRHFLMLVLFFFVGVCVSFFDPSFILNSKLQHDDPLLREYLTIVVYATISITYTLMCVRLVFVARAIKRFVVGVVAKSTELAITNSIHLKWPDSPRLRALKNVNIDTISKNIWLDVQLIESITKPLQGFFYYPVIVLLLLLASSLPIYENWPITGGFLYALLIWLGYTLLRAWNIHTICVAAKNRLLALLDDQKKRLQIGADDNRAEVAAIAYAVHRIENEHEGAFMPVTMLPIVRIIIIALGALGLILSQIYFGVGYSL